MIDGGLSLPLADGIALERDAFVEVFATDDSRHRCGELPRSTAPAKADLHRPADRDCSACPIGANVRRSMRIGGEGYWAQVARPRS